MGILQDTAAQAAEANDKAGEIKGLISQVYAGLQQVRDIDEQTGAPTPGLAEALETAEELDAGTSSLAFDIESLSITLATLAADGG